MKNKYTVTLIIPKDRTILERKYSEVLAGIVADMLTGDELGYLISELKKKEHV
ncbi:hypothetical protein G9F71_016420 [Clostridium sp. FP2]|uniref:hypothetical protein n=1 Tax=Clostridium sp. FP2 TaxID=2724481 RepID=UPI0013E94021|nr:hypothetical protein [Clostridium sp. FP2]MBZ9624437.1 hypothetical protein [Clostridium sp. FP2]